MSSSSVLRCMTSTPVQSDIRRHCSRQAEILDSDTANVDSGCCSQTGRHAIYTYTWRRRLLLFDHALLVSDVVEKTSTRRRSRILCVVVKKLRRVDVKAYASSSKKWRKSTNFQQKFVWFTTAITHTEIMIASCIFLIKRESVSD